MTKSFMDPVDKKNATCLDGYESHYVYHFYIFKNYASVKGSRLTLKQRGSFLHVSQRNFRC